ncbi:unnamed protein product [Closterium sp. NIES-64]|nr:unnamed protein product [Closterium sp. NIES-64]
MQNARQIESCTGGVTTGAGGVTSGAGSERPHVCDMPGAALLDRAAMRDATGGDVLADAVAGGQRQRQGMGGADRGREEGNAEGCEGRGGREVGRRGGAVRGGGIVRGGSVRAGGERGVGEINGFAPHSRFLHLIPFPHPSFPLPAPHSRDLRLNPLNLPLIPYPPPLILIVCQSTSLPAPHPLSPSPNSPSLPLILCACAS